MKKNGFTKILVLLLALVLAAAVPMQAYAAKKTVTATGTMEKAKAVKTGKQAVKLKTEDSWGYVKFKATKTKKYKFTVSNVRSTKTSSKKVIACGGVSFYKKDGYTSLTFKQDGEKGQSVLWVESKYSHSVGAATTYRTSRTASIKLKKGQTIYLSITCSVVGDGDALMDLTIK